jgi:hypothetical protein
MYPKMYCYDKINGLSFEKIIGTMKLTDLILKNVTL